MRRVFIIHRWGGTPESDWYPWLKQELEIKGFEVHVPAMPETDYPRMEKWIPFLKEQVGVVDENTFFIGHSIGGPTIVRYLEKLQENVKVGGVVFVAGWFTLQGLETDEEQEVAKPWLETPLDLNAVKTHMPKSIAIFSDNDPFVPLSDRDVFASKFDTKIIVEHAKDHYTESNGTTTLPVALNALLAMAR